MNVPSSMETYDPHTSSPGYHRRFRGEHALRASRSTKYSESLARFAASRPQHGGSRQSSSESLDLEVLRANSGKILARLEQGIAEDDEYRVDEKAQETKSTERPHRRELSSSEKIKKAMSRMGGRHRRISSNDSYTFGTDQFSVTMEEEVLKNPNFEDVGPLLLRLAIALHLSGENSSKALECASRAVKFFEKSASGRPSLDLAMSLQVLAAIYCRLGQYEDAVPILQRSIATSNLDQGVPYALAAFAGYMQLGDILSMHGQHECSISCYETAHNIQRSALGDMDPQVRETCSYLAEAHLKALQFDEAESYCQRALEIHSLHGPQGSLEEAADRRLMALIASGKGDHDVALNHLMLAHAALKFHGKDAEVAAVDCSMGDEYVALGQYEEAILSYQKSLILFKSVHGDSHTSVASVYVNLAALHWKLLKHRESKSYCEMALRIYGRSNAGHCPEEVANGLTEIASVFEDMNEREQALCLLQRSLGILETLPGQQNAVAGVEAQMGVLYYCLGKYQEAFMAFKDAISKLKSGTGNKSAQLGILLNQMGLACVGLNEIWHAAENFEESRRILEELYGKHHPESLAVCSNLAGAYDAMGRLDEAIFLLEHILEVKEGKLGTMHPDVVEERKRLSELLRESGRTIVKKLNTLEKLLFSSTAESSRCPTRRADVM